MLLAWRRKAKQNKTFWKSAYGVVSREGEK
jgi:hypothetical protein